ncbi:MAG: hypothetical protein V3U54_13515 [Thermodesulfobacteriota bacterium]
MTLQQECSCNVENQIVRMRVVCNKCGKEISEQSLKHYEKLAKKMFEAQR